MPRLVVIAICQLNFAGLSATMAAIVVHEAQVQRQAGTTLLRESDKIEVASSNDVDRDLDVTQTTNGWNGRAAIGQVGSVAMSGEVFNAQTDVTFSTTVFVSNSENVNFLGMPQRVTLNFIIDGGFMTVVGFDMRMQYFLTVAGSFVGPQGMVSNSFSSEGTLNAANNGSLTFTAAGDDIGAFYDPATRTVELPLSFHSLELGVVAPGETIHLAYAMTMQSQNLPVQNSFVEFAQWQFSDPGSLSQTPVLMSLEFEPVPEPGTLAMIAAGLASLCGSRRRWSVGGEAPSYWKRAAASPRRTTNVIRPRTFLPSPPPSSPPGCVSAGRCRHPRTPIRSPPAPRAVPPSRIRSAAAT